MGISTVVTGNGDDVSVPIEEYKRLMQAITPWVKLEVDKNSPETAHDVVLHDEESAGKGNSFKDKIAALRAMVENNSDKENTEE